MAENETPKYKRILLKLSGEALMGNAAFGINRDTLRAIVGEVKSIVDLGVELAIVVGGGQHLPWGCSRQYRYGSRYRRLHGYAGHLYECNGSSRLPPEMKALKHVFNVLWTLIRLPNRTFAAKLSAT